MKMWCLHVVYNTSKRLCFCDLALLLDPKLTTEQVSAKGKDLQLQVGLSLDTDVSFRDITRFERVLDSKIVVFVRRQTVRGL